MFKKLLSILLIFSILIPQEIFEFTEEEVQTLYTSIQELEQADSLNTKMINNLESQIGDYIQIIQNDSLIMSQYRYQLKLKDEIIEMVEPKWYDNKYIWFGLGILFTSVSVNLAGNLK